ncbi:MAG: hypothetical protein QXE10_01930 [Desulfurococcaceae archaeon]
MGVASLLDLDLKALLDRLESRTGVRLPWRVVEIYLDEEHDLLFIRFKEPRKTEVGEPLELKSIVTLFTDEESGEVTAIEVIGLSKLLEELGFHGTTTRDYL